MQHKKRGTLFFCSVLTFCNLCEETTDIDARSIFIQTVYARVFMPRSSLTPPPQNISLFIVIYEAVCHIFVSSTIHSFFSFFLLTFIGNRMTHFSLLILLLHFPPSLSLLCSLSFTLGLCFFLSPPYPPFILGADPGVLSLLIRFSSALDFCFVLWFG